MQIATVTTSSIRSANIDVKVPVPTWAPDGAASVQGDGSYGHVQMNTVTVSGGPLTTSTIKTATPSPTPTMPPSATPTSMLSPEATAIPSTPDAMSTPWAETSTPEATTSPETPTRGASPTATAQPTDTVVPIETPTPDTLEGMPTPKHRHSLTSAYFSRRSSTPLGMTREGALLGSG